MSWRINKQMSSDSKPKFKIIIKEQQEKQELEEGFLDYVSVIGGDIKNSVQNYFKSVGDRANTRSNRRAANTIIRELQSQLAPLKKKCDRNPSQCDERTKKIIQNLEGLISNLQENPDGTLEAIDGDLSARRVLAPSTPITGTRSEPSAQPEADGGPAQSTEPPAQTTADGGPAQQPAQPAKQKKPKPAQKARQLRKNPKPGKVLSRASALYRLQAAGVDNPKEKATQISQTIKDFLKDNPSIKDKVKVLAENVNLTVGKESLLATLRKSHPDVDTRILQIIVSDIAAQLKASSVGLISTKKQLRKSKEQQRSDSGEEQTSSGGKELDQETEVGDQGTKKEKKTIFDEWLKKDFDGDKTVREWLVDNNIQGGDIISRLRIYVKQSVAKATDESAIRNDKALKDFIFSIIAQNLGYNKNNLKRDERKNLNKLLRKFNYTINPRKSDPQVDLTGFAIAEGRTLQESFNKRNQKIYNSLLKKFLKN